MNSFVDTVRINWRTIMATIAMIVDALILAASFIIAAKINRHDLSLPGILESYGHLLLFAVILFIAFSTAVGVYRTITSSPFVSRAFRSARAYIYTLAVILSVLFLVRNAFYSRFFLGLATLVVPVLYVLVWSLIHATIRWLGNRYGIGRWSTVAIGTEPNLSRLIRRLKENPELGYDVVGVIRAAQAGTSGGDLKIARADVEEMVEKQNPGLIVFSSSNLNGSFDELEEMCIRRSIATRIYSPDLGHLFTKTKLYDIDGIPIFSPRRGRIEAAKLVVKRAFDIVGASIALVLLSPLLLVIAVATKLESRGPVFFTQLRSLSDDDAPFRFYKFRSMHNEADEQKDELLEQNETDGALFKIKDDPRLTNIGRFIRRFSLDEVPQFFNVLKGEMSLVGPRPLPARDFTLLQEADHMGGYFRQRANAKPGMTGLWQISGRSDIGFREMVLLDLYYIENQSLLFDIEILAQTLPVVLFGKGAY